MYWLNIDTLRKFEETQGNSRVAAANSSNST